MRVYIASHCRWAACHVADVFSDNGNIDIVSGWHYKEFRKTEDHTESERHEIAVEDFEDLRSSDALVLVSGPDKYSGGKFVETGIALGMGKKVIVIGRRENMLMWLPQIIQVDTPTDAEQALWD